MTYISIIPALFEDMLLNDDTRDGVEEHNSTKVYNSFTLIILTKMFSHLADDTGGD